MPGLLASVQSKVVALWLRRPLNARHMVCWYGDIIPNIRASTVPLVEVTLRPYRDLSVPREWLSPDAFGPPTTRAFPATTLGQYRIGSLIRGRKPEDTLRHCLSQQDFDVDFSVSGWSFQLASEAFRPYTPLPVPWLEGLHLDFPLIAFRMSCGRTLLVPCVEFFSRCYGHSKELQRVLLTYPWSEVEHRLFRNLDAPPPGFEGNWYVRFGPHMSKSDAVFLAHIQYDAYTTGTVKRIYAKREAAGGSPNPRVPLDVGPWFQDRAKLRVLGYKLGDDAFLAVRVDGSSEPAQGPPVYFEQPSNESESEEDPALGDEHPRLWRRFFRPPPDLPLHGGTDPDVAAGSGHAPDPDFVILGARRIVIPSPKPRDAGRRRSGPGRAQVPREFSTSDPRSTGEGIGQVQFGSARLLDSEGVLLDMWNALQLLHARHPDEVQSVEWFTFSGGLGSDSPPNLIALPTPRSEAGDRARTAADRWCLIEPDVPLEDARTRGVLVAQIRVLGVLLCILEIERRRAVEEKEERYLGLVFPLGHSNDLEEVLPPLLVALPTVQGRIGSLEAHWPVGAKLFKHCASKTDSLPCEGTVVHALRKMDIKRSHGKWTVSAHC